MRSSATAPKATAVCGDGTDRDLLKEEGLERFESFAALTNIDEENVLLSLYAKKVAMRRSLRRSIVSRLTRSFQSRDLDTVIHPKISRQKHTSVMCDQ